MLYLARELHLPSGEVLERYVVSVNDDGVAEWHPFETECQSMLLVEKMRICANGVAEFETEL